jgi:hypothetical protein
MVARCAAVSVEAPEAEIGVFVYIASILGT